jgi:hypothetical protein
MRITSVESNGLDIAVVKIPKDPKEGESLPRREK